MRQSLLEAGYEGSTNWVGGIRERKKAKLQKQTELFATGTHSIDTVSNHMQDNAERLSLNRGEITLSILKSSAPVTSPSPAINMTPLIDVLLVLLIIFMVIQPQKEAKLPVKAPAPAQVNQEPSPETLMLTVSGDMQLELNSKPIEVGELLPLLDGLMERRTLDTRTLFIKAPPILAYGPVVLLIDLAKGAGVVTIGLVRDDS